MASHGHHHKAKSRQYMVLTPADTFNYREYIHQACGLNIPDDKLYLIQHRLEPLAMANQCASFAEFFLKLKNDADNALRDQVIAAITTNETSFFRDTHPFDTFRDLILREFLDKIKRNRREGANRPDCRLRILSAGCSTGQEPYALAMLLHEFVQGNRFQGVVGNEVCIVATDISPQVLGRAMAGEYSAEELTKGVPEDLRRKYFRQVGARWVAQSEIRNYIQFRRANLLDSYALNGPFSVIFCRNVLIYFDDPTKQRVLDHFYKILSPGGYLILGSTEVLLKSDRYQSIRNGPTILYQKIG